jgi:hypothetical protein
MLIRRARRRTYDDPLHQVKTIAPTRKGEGCAGHEERCGDRTHQGGTDTTPAIRRGPAREESDAERHGGDRRQHGPRVLREQLYNGPPKRSPLIEERGVARVHAATSHLRSNHSEPANRVLGEDRIVRKLFGFGKAKGRAAEIARLLGTDANAIRVGESAIEAGRGVDDAAVGERFEVCDRVARSLRERLDP